VTSADNTTKYGGEVDKSRPSRMDAPLTWWHCR
jgi:hypothetical protein